MKFHVDGELIAAEDATVSVRDRGFMYGDAAFETLRAYGGSIFEWEAHADRLRSTCELLGIDHGIADEILRSRIDETLAGNDLDEAYVKLSISRGVQPGKLTPGPTTDPTVVVYVAELPRGGVGSEPVWDAPTTVRSIERQRVSDEAIPARAKTHNYLNGIMARLDAPDADEQLMCDADGFVAEGATSNLFFVRDGVLHTPSLDGPILPGVTRRIVLELADEVGIPIEEGAYRPEEVREADEMFLTNTTWEVRPVANLDGIEFGEWPVIDRLARAFDELVEERHY